MRDGVTIYCIRHGETDWNAQQRYQGQADIPLNDKGRAQAKRNGMVLRQIPKIRTLDFIASPLGRTRETMEIVRTALGMSKTGYAMDDRLREVHYGHWEGQLAADLPTYDPVGLAARRENPFHWCPTGGESYSDLMVRVEDWMTGIKRDTVVVAHGGISRSLRGALIGADMSGVLRLIAPQDKVLAIQNGHMEWL